MSWKKVSLDLGLAACAVLTGIAIAAVNINMLKAKHFP